MWNIIQCAVKGRSHEKVNMPCQDKTYALFENDVQTIALADGAGSALRTGTRAETGKAAGIGRGGKTAGHRWLHIGGQF